METMQGGKFIVIGPDRAMRKKQDSVVDEVDGAFKKAGITEAQLDAALGRPTVVSAVYDESKKVVKAIKVRNSIPEKYSQEGVEDEIKIHFVHEIELIDGQSHSGKDLLNKKDKDATEKLVKQIAESYEIADKPYYWTSLSWKTKEYDFPVIVVWVAPQVPCIKCNKLNDIQSKMCKHCGYTKPKVIIAHTFFALIFIISSLFFAYKESRILSILSGIMALIFILIIINRIVKNYQN